MYRLRSTNKGEKHKPSLPEPLLTIESLSPSSRIITAHSTHVWLISFVVSFICLQLERLIPTWVQLHGCRFINNNQETGRQGREYQIMRLALGEPVNR